jgi:hypothetical protein
LDFGFVLLRGIIFLFSMQRTQQEGHARGDDAAEKHGNASRKRAAWYVTLQNAMTGFPEPARATLGTRWTHSRPQGVERRDRDKEDDEEGDLGIIVAVEDR